MNKIDQIFTKDIKVFAKSYFEYLGEIFSNINLSDIQKFTETLLVAREKGVRIFFIGNGGSASTSSHFANDLAFGVNEYDKPFRVMSLTDNVSVLTALGNDFGYDDIFTRQLRVYAKKDDILVGISASGNSPNLLSAFEYAKKNGINTIALTAFDGGKLKEIADQGIHIPTGMKEYGPAEDVHMILDHLVSAYLSRFLKNT